MHVFHQGLESISSKRCSMWAIPKITMIINCDSGLGCSVCNIFATQFQSEVLTGVFKYVSGNGICVFYNSLNTPIVIHQQLSIPIPIFYLSLTGVQLYCRFNSHVDVDYLFTFHYWNSVTFNKETPTNNSET